MNAALMKRLFRAISDGSQEDLHKMAKVIIEDEMKKGHGGLAKELNGLLKEKPRSSMEPKNLPLQPSTAPSNLSVLPRSRRYEQPLYSNIPSDQLEHNMILPPAVEERFRRIEQEYAARERLALYGLLPRKKILLYGPPGCGKTMGAQRLAWNTGLEFYKVRFDAIVSSYLGETAANLRAIFEAVAQTPCLLLIDECDSIAKSRQSSQEVGEIKRIVNSFLQLLDDYDAPGLLVCATNLDSELDTAIWRRFDDILEVPKPGQEEINKLIETTLAAVKTQGLNWEQLLKATNDYSAAQIVRGCRNAMKSVVLAGQETVTNGVLLQAIQESGEKA
ncbi:AAA family ATPase [Desulfitobacterium hafniense]|uniref:AAA family ATPase n=1 Tax=Desulfitobacterium hafniense TaxID=49338 RepID=UPI0003754CCE|nr:ATP-binding protein [Desulfitobacterium hafniense]